MTLDKIGMTASSICGVHCILTPFILILFPYASIAFVDGKMFEWGFMLFSLIVACFALIQGFLTHKKWVPLALASFGFSTFITVKILYGHSAETFSGALVFVMAGALICVAHLLNHKFCKKNHCECEHK